MFEMPRSFSIKLHSETQVSVRLSMSGGRSPRHAQNPLSGEWGKTLSITHHALSPPPAHHHLYIIHLINWRFYRITMSLKRTFVPKSDVYQWFTTTTTITIKKAHIYISYGEYFQFCTRVVHHFSATSLRTSTARRRTSLDSLIFTLIYL